MQLREIVRQDITDALARLKKQEQWSVAMPDIKVEVPQQSGHGDFATNVALMLAKPLRQNPLQIATALADQLQGNYAAVDVAAPGFINITLSEQQLADSVAHVLAAGDQYGQETIGHNQKVLFEFISANPTGPLTLPNGRGGYLGDVLGNVYSALGYDVTREYYINDRGNQIDILGESVARRYLQLHGLNVGFEDNMYQGEYITELAEQLDIDSETLNSPEKIEWLKNHIKVKALELMLAEIKRVVTEKMGIQFDSWYSEAKMYQDGVVETAIAVLQEDDQTYEKDGAVWLKTSDYGDDKDRVLIKATGEGAYMQGDAGLFYRRAITEKYRKAHIILGADHHGYERRLKALKPMFDADMDFELLFTQMATLVKDGKEVRISKRKGNFVTIEELIDEVGPDVARFFFLMYSTDSHMQFDLDLAKEQSNNNPVYYVQYAYARICSMLREVTAQGAPERDGDIQVAESAERQLVLQLQRLPELLQDIAKNYEVHHLTTYAVELARAFHHFYAHCRVIEDNQVNESRYRLVLATQIVLANTLRLLGVSAPETM